MHTVEVDKYWIPITKTLPKDEEGVPYDGTIPPSSTNTFQTNQTAPEPSPIVDAGREKETADIECYSVVPGLSGPAESPAEESSKRSSLPIATPVSAQSESPGHPKLKAVPIPVVPSIPLQLDPQPNTSSDLPTETDPELQPYRVSERRKAPVRPQPTSPEITVSQMSLHDDPFQSSQDLDPALRPVSAHIYENAATWVASIISTKDRSRGLPVPQRSPLRGPIRETPIYMQEPTTTAYHYDRQYKEARLDLSAMDPTSDYVPMTPCTRSHSLKQMMY